MIPTVKTLKTTTEAEMFQALEAAGIIVTMPEVGFVPLEGYTVVFPTIEGGFHCDVLGEISDEQAAILPVVEVPFERRQHVFAGETEIEVTIENPETKETVTEIITTTMQPEQLVEVYEQVISAEEVTPEIVTPSE